MIIFRKFLTGFIAGGVVFFLIHTSFYGRAVDYKFMQPVMGTLFSVTIYGVSEDEARAAAQSAFALAHSIEAELSRFREDSELTRVNNCAAVPQKIGRHFLNCLKQSIAVSELTNGYFDVTFLPLYEAWDWRNHPSAEPSRETIETLLKNVGYKKIIIDETNSIVLIRPGMKLDFGGVAKCYAVGVMAVKLMESGIKDAIVSGGGDLFITSKRFYSLGVQDPFSPVRGDMIGKIIIEGPAAVFTSGDYEQYSVIGSKKYGHIINPYTGYPASGLKSATIIHKVFHDAPGISAGIIAMGEARAKNFVESNKIAALLINESGEIYLSQKFSERALFIKNKN